MNKQIPWINTGRAVCMILVYFFHSEFCCKNNLGYSYFFSPFFLSFFFFISGYLMLVPGQRINVKHKLRSILSKMVWPYFVFTSLIWFPKMIRHGMDTDISSYFTDVFGGTASWFVAALIVAELIIILASSVIKDTRWYLLLGIVTFTSALVINKYFPSPQPWYYKSGMMGIFFMSIGGWYRFYQDKLEWLVKWRYCILAFAAYMAIMLFDYHTFRYTPSIGIVRYESIPLGLLENLTGICFILLLVRLMPLWPPVNYIGKYSLPFYFLSGACPFFAAAIFYKVATTDSYLATFIIALIALAIAYAATLVINRFCPIMLNLYYRSGKKGSGVINPPKQAS